MLYAQVSKKTLNNFNKINVNNCIIRRNTAPDIWRHFFNAGQKGEPLNLYDYQFDNCILSALECSLPGGEQACGNNLLFATDPLFLDTMQMNLRVASYSPAINAGNNMSSDTLGIQIDLDDQARIQEGQVDIGAYERPSYHVQLDEVTQPSCAGESSGSIQFQIIGDSPYEYHWENDSGMEGAGVDSLFSGNYHFTVTDKFACMDTISIQIGAPDSLLVEAHITHASVTQQGEIEIVTIAGGEGPYQLLWNTQDTSSSISKLSPGLYHLTVTDSKDCRRVFHFMVDLIEGINAWQEVESIFASPNPVSRGSHLFVQWKNASISSQELQLQLYNSVGKIVYNEKNWQGEPISLSSALMPGLYLLKILDNNNAYLVASNWIKIY